MKKFIFIFESLELGGAEMQGFLLARRLRDEHGFDVQIWGLTPSPGRLSDLCDESSISWRGISVPWHTQFFYKLKELSKFAILLKQERPDILVPYTWLPNIACGLVWKFTGARLCVWNQEDEGIGLNTSLFHRLAIWLTPCFISNSTGGKNFLINTYKIHHKKISIVHNGISLASPLYSRYEWRKRLNLSEDCFIACMLSNIHKNKDHLTLLKAWRVVLERATGEKNKPVLLLAGRCDEIGNELQELAYSLIESVKFIGQVKDVAGLLSAIDLCVHSSKSEGLPNAVLEAMASGLPIVATDIPGIREAVGIEGSQHLSPPCDSLIFADHIMEFFHNPDLRRINGQALQKRATECFSLHKMYANSVSLFATKLKT